MSKEVRRRSRPRDGPGPSKSYSRPSQKSSKSPGGLLTKLAISAVAAGVVLVIAYMRYQTSLKSAVKTPLQSPTILADNSSSAAENPDRFWGTYRSHMYFGMKTRSKASPVVGLMWLTQFTGQMPPPLRHWCDQGDRLQRYGWMLHDGVNFGSQDIHDSTYMLRTQFVKRPGGQHGGDWSARVKAVPYNPNKPATVSLMFYMALDGQGQLEPQLTKKRLSSIKGYSEELGHFELKFPKNTATGARNSHLISHSPQLDKLKDVLMASMAVDAWDKKRTLPYFVLNGRAIPSDQPTNFVVHQVTATLPFEMEVVFESGSVTNRRDTLAGNVFENALQNHVSTFNERFLKTFPLKERGYSVNEINFAKAALSNMVGSIGYFYGSSLVQSIYNEEPVEYWQTPLYTGVPSRPFFPRGFLWDEGFHNLLISQWDPSISKDIIAHWLDTMNVEGWIPREQILGVEARAKVPGEFVVQRNKNANPPTFFLPLQRLIKDMIKSNTLKDRTFLSALYPRLKAWYSWYNSSQVGKDPSSYRWRGRDATAVKQLNPLTLTSGLDDYPRSSHPTDDERHVDLRCWLALASGVMADIARSLAKDWEEYDRTHKLLTDNDLLDKLHWSEQGQQYSDYGLHTDRVKLERPKPQLNLQPGQRPPPMNQDKIRVTQEEPKNQFVNIFGYVSLFPFLLKIVEPDSPKLYKILNDLKNPSLLWTDYGLRSLSQSAKLYNRYNTEHDPPYWRGAIWINMNYLALGALDFYSRSRGPYQNLAASIYKDLRKNIVDNLMTNYEKTGYIWENYSDKTGEGKGSHPFTGWSALVVLIMGERY
ncbi:mannosyl-oligosaccharide glucosidase-like [Haliotis cracherodii]|uniref:mannosyl-oligosaccharide glucosidase-like n=1 Tax=Haliotis cracherodii TaxID=6455 RepID=UPI0039E81213